MRANNSRGAVLVAVLWAIALLSALAMAASTTFRGFVGIMAVDRDRVQAEALLTAGVEMAAGVVERIGEAPLYDTQTSVALTTGRVTASISDETGRIDIGQAPAEVLAGLLRSVGAPEALANDLASRIVDLRPQQSGKGTERRAASARKRSPTDQPFADIAELAYVPGMAAEWIAAMRPLTTVFGSATINPLTAPDRVIAALPGIDGGRLEAFLAERRNAGANADRVIAMLGSAARFVGAKQQAVASVDLVARLTNNGHTAAAHAVIVVLPEDSQPYRVLSWTPRPTS